MAYIPKNQFGCNTFSETASYGEQAIFRRIALHGGNFTKSQRTVLVKLVNLWLRHRSKGWFAATNDALCKALGLSIRSIRVAVSMLRDMGILVRLDGGLGRGNVSIYAVDLHQMQQEIAPDVEVICAGEKVSLDGEIKGAKTASAYIDKKQISQPVRITLPRSVNWDTLGRILRRCGMARRAWFRTAHQVTNPLGSKIYPAEAVF